MRYLDFLAKFKEKKIISIQDIKNAFSQVNNAQLSDWQKKKQLIKVKRGIFVLPDAKIDLHILSNELNYSYISLEYALSYYQLIPDYSQVITAVSKNRAEKISNDFGHFHYRKISGELFGGFVLIESPLQKDRFFRLATAEKALFDLIYFRADMKSRDDFESLRLDLPLKFNLKMMEKYISIVKASQTKKRLNNLILFLYDRLQ
jgi:predicted transcriptional regulator of viral defense system